jgi:hypothetical protein
VLVNFATALPQTRNPHGLAFQLRSESCMSLKASYGRTSSLIENGYMMRSC